MSDRERPKTVIGATSVASSAMHYAEEALRKVEQARNGIDLSLAFNLLSMWAQELTEAADAGYRLASQFKPNKDDNEGEGVVS